MPGLTLVVANRPDRAESPAHDPAIAFGVALFDGVHIDPPPTPSEARAWLAELGAALAELADGQRLRAAVRLGLGAVCWEAGLERSGDAVLVSLFQTGAVPEVALHERRIDGDVALGLAARALTAPELSDDERLDWARERLERARPFRGGASRAVEAEVVTIEPTGDAPIAFSAEVLLRDVDAPASAAAASVTRADLLPLLFRGKLRVDVGDQRREIPDAFVFLVAEQLVVMVSEAAEAWARGRPYYRRLVVGGAVVGVRLGALGAAALTLGKPRVGGDARAQTWTFPAVDVATLARGVVAFGRALTRSLVRRDRAQAHNLRLTAFRACVRELEGRVRDATRNDAKVNEAPESYRAFAAAARPKEPTDAFGSARLNFTARWMAAVPAIDLRSTFLCGDRLIIGSAREVACLDGRTGEVLWKRAVQRAVGVMTPLGLARLSPDGGLALHDLESGDVVWSTALAPRASASASGAVVGAPGLPKMLIVTEGQRHLTAVDLHAGDVRWRYAARRGAALRLKRAGKLVIVAGGEHSLVALDVLSGEVVWRFCDRLRFASPVAVDHDALFALSGDGAFVARGGTRLHHLDPWSGAAHWSVDLPPNVATIGAPLVTPEAVVVATFGRRGTGLIAFDRKTGAARFEQTVCSSAASCLAVDRAIIVNGEGGELLAVNADDGSTAYRHVFATGAEGDRPRRLEPVLRSGALFVPQTEVQVIRPRDGAILGRVPNDIIPDLLRVDPRCDVYVAEESGHVAAYAAGPRLSLVRA
jgi:outer membrane protein assembly factor BamB